MSRVIGLAHQNKSTRQTDCSTPQYIVRSLRDYTGNCRMWF